MNKDTKRQHYVPKTYLKHFSKEKNGSYFIHAVKITDFSMDKSYAVNINNICLQNDAYTLSGAFPLLLENIYGDLESEYNDIYNFLTDPVKQSITEKERTLIIATVITMLFRTTKVPSSINQTTNKIVELAYTAYQKTGSRLNIGGEVFSFDDKTPSQIQKEIADRGKPVIAAQQLQFASKLIEYRIKNDMISVLRLDNDVSEFITSDNPVSCINETTPFLAPFNPTNNLTLPLDNKHVLLLIPKPKKNDRNKIFRITETGEEAFRQMLTVNGLQQKQGERFLLGSEDAIKRYIYIVDNIDILTRQIMNKVTNKRES